MSRTALHLPPLYPAVAWTLLMFALSSVPRLPRETVPFLHYDKVLHLIEYGVFSWLWGSVLRSSGNPFLRRYAWGIVLLIGVAWGAFDETYQGWVGRSKDLNDFLADLAGVGLAQVFQERRMTGKGAG